MTSPNEPLRPHPRATQIPLGHERAGALLRMGLSKPRRGIDDVADRLQALDGPEWLERAVGTLPVRSGSNAADLLAAGRVSLEDLQAWKENYKASMTAPGSPDDRSAAILMYYLCLAAARTAHSQSITSQPPEEVAEAMIDLAAAIPEPWSTLLARAGLSFGVPAT